MVSTGDGWQRNEDVVYRQSSRLERNTQLDTGEQNLTDIGM